MSKAVLIPFPGGDLVATLHLPANPGRIAVVFVTGGHQTRAGSHRQYLMLARRFAAEGHACLRFDPSGLGDSAGELRAFDKNADALRAAIDCICKQVAGAREIVLWGLCDGATMAGLYAAEDPRVHGLLLVNPWVRSAYTEAKALVHGYYRQRFLSPAFWQKLVSGEVDIVRSAREWIMNRRAARKPTDAVGGPAERLLAALSEFGKPIRIIVSEHDLTGQEFLSIDLGHMREACCMLAGADHTCSMPVHQAELETHSLNFLLSLAEKS